MLKVAGGAGGGGSGTVTQIDTGTGLTGGPITTTGTISLANTAVSSGTYGSNVSTVSITVDAQGRITNIANVAIQFDGNGTVTNIATGTGLTGGPITTTGTVSIANTTVTAGAYGDAATVGTFTVNAQGQLTAAANASISIAPSQINAAIPNSGLANSSTTLGNATLTLGGTTSTVGNLTLTNVTISSGTISNVTVTSNLVTKTSAYAATASDQTILGNATTGSFSVTLPTSVGITGKIYIVKKVDSSVNTVTIATTSAQTIDGAASKVLSYQYDGMQIQSDGANWVIIASISARNGVSGTF